jgi:hypothetical protein
VSDHITLIKKLFKETAMSCDHLLTEAEEYAEFYPEEYERAEKAEQHLTRALEELGLT